MNFSWTNIVQFIREILLENRRQLKIILDGRCDQLYEEKLNVR